MPVRYIEWFIRGRSYLRPPISVCVYTPIKAILHQPRTLPLARYVILSWVEPLPYANGRGCQTRLVTTHLETWLRDARYHKCCSRSFFSPIFSLLSDKKIRPGHLPRTSWARGIWTYFRACPFLGSWCALLCEEVHVRAGRGCSVFGGLMTGASVCRRVVRAKCYVSHSGQFADFEARPVLTPCQDEGMSSRTT